MVIFYKPEKVPFFWFGFLLCLLCLFHIISFKNVHYVLKRNQKYTKIKSVINKTKTDDITFTVRSENRSHSGIVQKLSKNSTSPRHAQ